MATDTLTTVATFHPAKDFFASRGAIAMDMEKELKALFAAKNFINIPLFQFQVRRNIENSKRCLLHRHTASC
jgi:hypothetical protein